VRAVEETFYLSKRDFREAGAQHRLQRPDPDPANLFRPLTRWRRSSA
jgi:hypothetical protein